MDENTMERLCAAYMGMSADDIEAALMASKHAARVPDPRALAEYIASYCAPAE